MEKKIHHKPWLCNNLSPKHASPPGLDCSTHTPPPPTLAHTRPQVLAKSHRYCQRAPAVFHRRVKVANQVALDHRRQPPHCLSCALVDLRTAGTSNCTTVIEQWRNSILAHPLAAPRSARSGSAMRWGAAHRPRRSARRRRRHDQRNSRRAQ